MDVSLWKVCQIIGYPPPIWSIRNPLKIYEYMEVLRNSGIHKNDTILDLGCGKGHWTLALAKKCKKATGVDNSQGQINVANGFLRNSKLRNKVNFICGQLEDLSMQCCSYDKVFSFCVLEHIPNLREVLNEVFLILKPGGELHVSVDSLANISDPKIIEKHKKDHAVIQYFSSESLRQILQEVGLSVMEIKPILTSSYAVEEFEKRIAATYKHGLLKRTEIYNRFQSLERDSQAQEGLMLIGRARKEL